MSDSVISQKLEELIEKEASLEDKIQNLITTVRAELPEDIVKKIEQGAGAIEKSLLSLSPLKVGEFIPLLTLKDHVGKDFIFSEELNRGLHVITFYRGEWCPYCNLQLREYQKHIDLFIERGVNLVAISPQTPEGSLSTINSNDLKFTVLSDEDNILAESFGLTFQVPDEHVEVFKALGSPLEDFNGHVRSILPDPATFIVDAEGKVLWRFLPKNYRKRVEIEDLLKAIDSIK